MIVLDESTLQKMKNIQLEMLRIFIGICQKHDLKYFMMGGSCLGAVRHQGFIPWDDDIDVGMPREDYEKFMEIGQAELPECYFLQNSKTDMHYPMNFAKIRQNGTAFFESSVAHIPMHHGVYMDIFPIDGYRESRFLKLRLKRLCWGVSKIFPHTKSNSKIKQIIKSILIFSLRDYHKVRDKIERLVIKETYGDAQTVINHFGAWGDKEIMPKEVYGEGSMGIFEGIDVVLPADPHRYLERMYGDYMKLPPPEARVPHHYCDIIDLEKSYLEYLK